MPNNENAAFRWISNDSHGAGAAYVTIDKNQRLYLSSGARDALKLPPNTPARLIVGYDAANKRLVIAKPEVVRAADVKPFKFDKRSYSSARNFLRKAGVQLADLPKRYVLIGKEYAAYAEGSYAFELDDYDAPDAH